MKINRLFPVVLMLLLSIGFNSCNKDELIDDDGKRDYVEICKNVADIDYAIVDYYKKCASIDELKQYADEIRALKGVEDVYFNETTTMFVKIKDFRTVFYSYCCDTDDEEAATSPQQMPKRIKANVEAEGNGNTYSHRDFDDAKVLIVNAQTDRDWSKRSALSVKYLFDELDNVTARIAESPNIEFFRNEIFDCDYLYIIAHGVYDRSLHWIGTSTEVPYGSDNKIDATALANIIRNYPENQVTYGYYGNSKKMISTYSTFYVSELFIDSNNQNFNHPGQGVVFNLACQSMQGPSSTAIDSINYSLTGVFYNKGAGAYLGYDESNKMGQAGAVEFWSRLASGMSVKSAYEDLSDEVIHDHMSDNKTNREWWADLVLYAPHMKETCIVRPIITFEDKSNDDGLLIDLHAENLYTRYVLMENNKEWHAVTDSELENLPFRYGFELSESEDFTNVINTGEKKFGEEGSTTAYLDYTQSLKYNASESNSKIKPETTYWARAYVYDGSGYNYSEPVTFTTKAYSRIDHVIPPDIRDQMDPYITIYDGNNPPNIEGEFIISPSELTYNSVGDYPVGHVFADTYIKFLNQDMHANTLDYREKQASSTQTGEGAFISGEGNNFSVFFNTDGIGHYSDYDISYKTALIISGTKDTNGIHNLQYAFVLVDKSDDPKPYIISVGDFRVIKDGDGYSPATTWASFLRKMKQSNQQHKPSFLEWKKR